MGLQIGLVVVYTHTQYPHKNKREEKGRQHRQRFAISIVNKHVFSVGHCMYLYIEKATKFNKNGFCVFNSLLPLLHFVSKIVAFAYHLCAHLLYVYECKVFKVFYYSPLYRSRNTHMTRNTYNKWIDACNFYNNQLKLWASSRVLRYTSLNVDLIQFANTK